MIEEVNSKGVEDLIKNVDNPDDAAELIERVEHIMKSKKNLIHFSSSRTVVLIIFKL